MRRVLQMIFQPRALHAICLLLELELQAHSHQIGCTVHLSSRHLHQSTGKMTDISPGGQWCCCPSADAKTSRCRRPQWSS